MDARNIIASKTKQLAAGKNEKQKTKQQWSLLNPHKVATARSFLNKKSLANTFPSSFLTEDLELVDLF